MKMFVRSLSLEIRVGFWWLMAVPVFANPAPPSPLRINEWMTINLSYPDETGVTGPWIELYNAGNAVVNLAGWHLSDSVTRPTQWTFPAGVAVPVGGHYVVWVDGKDGANHTNFRLNADGGSIGLFDPDRLLRDWVQYGSLPPDASEGRLPDGAAAIQLLPSPTPGADNNEGVVRPSASAQVVLSPAGATWKYFDRSQNLGNAWIDPAYNDANWPSGPAQLGFGDNDEATVVSGGSAALRNTTIYFRRTFVATNTTLYSNLVLRLLRDDGVVVYLNGTEIHRDNMPSGPVQYATLALSDVDGFDENRFFTTTLPVNRLLSGNNVLAVEVHQSSGTSDDLSFDLELLAAGQSLPGVVTRPGFISVPPGSCVELTAPPGIAPAGTKWQWLRNNQILPGETSRTLQRCGLQTGDGGAYGLLVTAPDGRTTVIDPTDVVINVPVAPLSADNFQSAMPLGGISGVIRGNNSNASREPNEGFHNGVEGGRSMWFRWSAPATGVATFDTLGSTFDTLLAVYTGPTISNLQSVASDDERGGFSTSTASFNAVANGAYLIAIDGFEGASGYFNLRWSLQGSAAPIPTIASEPEAETVPFGGTAIFSVGVMQPNATYQWLRNGQIIPNEVSSQLKIQNVTSDVLGDYSVRVSTALGQFVESAAAGLFLGDCARFYRRPYSYLNPCDRLHRLQFVPAGFGGSTNPVSAGVPGAIQLGGHLYGEANYKPSSGTYFICEGITIQSPQFYDLQITDDGFLRLDTCGSDFPAVLALYHKAPVRYLEPTYRIACDLTSAALGHPAMVTAQVTGGVYTVIVGRLTLSSSESTIRLNERLSPSLFLASEGGPPVVLKVNTNRSEWASEPFTSFRWFKDEVPFASTPGPALTVGSPVPGVQLSHVGTYSLVMTNLTRKASQLVADVIVTNVPSANFYRLRGGPSNDGGLQRMELEARCSRPLWLESSASFIDTPISWSPFDRWITNYAVVFLECDEPLRTQRYFRQRILEP